MDYNGVGLRGKIDSTEQALLEPATLAFLAQLHRMFEGTRQSVLEARREQARWIAEGMAWQAPAETSAIRDGAWSVAAIPDDLRPALLSSPRPGRNGAEELGAEGPDILVRSFDDAITPSFTNVLQLQLRIGEQLRAAANRPPFFIEPRGWHLPEAHLAVDGDEIAGALFDFGLFFIHHVAPLVAKGRRPLLLLPKLEHYLEARLWANVLVTAQSIFGLPLGTVRVIAAIETLPARHMVDEILFELRDHVVALSFDPVDYGFSLLKSGRQAPDRADDTAADPATPLLAVPEIAAAAQAIAMTAAKRGAFAFLQQRRASATPDAHPDATDVHLTTLDAAHEQGTANGAAPLDSAAVARAIRLALSGLESWIAGRGAAVIDGQPVDTATIELLRTRLWCWRTGKMPLADGGILKASDVNRAIQEELAGLKDELPAARFRAGKFREAATVLLDLVLARDCPEFFTIPAYRTLIAHQDESNSATNAQKDR